MAGEDNHVYGFSKTDAMQLLNGIGSGGGRGMPAGTGYPDGKGFICMTPSGGIAARSGSTVSSAECTVYNIEGNTLTSAGTTVDVYNMSATAVAGSVYILAFWFGGKLVTPWEDC